MINKTVPFFLILFFLLGGKLVAQISPGDLTRYHSHLEGMSNCTKCHVLGEKVYDSKCLDCHTEIDNLIKTGKGYHAGTSVKGKECRDCHSEHHGRNFRIVNFDKENFNHTQAGFELTGSHKKINCSSCHQGKFIKDNQIRKRNGTYLGLEGDCISCHKDFHKGTLGNNCTSCHNTEKFKPASYFDHDKTDFRLTGSHKTVECSKCHPAASENGEVINKFKVTSFDKCTACHRDVHNGRFGAGCQECHSTNSFHQINQSAFDHNKTNFPLVGKHLSVKCNDCHKTTLSRPKHERCTDCHSDYHRGEFTINGIVKDCSACHNEMGFTPSLFSVQEHDLSEFKLTGSHLAVPCGQCHFKNNKWFFKNIGLECIACHNNVHGEEISARFMGNNNCSGCHNTSGWSSVSFKHEKTGYILLGRHLEAGCGNCHYRENGTKKEFKFSNLKKGCVVCHNDYHLGQFDESECENCHSFNNWKPEKFDHNKAGFKLEGAHSKIQCSGCHKVVRKNSVSFIEYKLEKLKCSDCHT